jgi:hypothetical protein
MPPKKDTKKDKKEDAEAEVPAVVDEYGSFLFPDNSEYEGNYHVIDGKRIRHGFGKYVNGPESYEGMWENDMMVGMGEYKFCSGAVYKVNISVSYDSHRL